MCFSLTQSTFASVLQLSLEFVGFCFVGFFCFVLIAFLGKKNLSCEKIQAIGIYHCNKTTQIYGFLFMRGC